MEQEPSYREAVDHVLASGRPRAATLQRLMRIGNETAVELLERMEADGIVSPRDAFGLRELLPDAAAVRETLPAEPERPMAVMEREKPAAGTFDGLLPDPERASRRDQEIAESVRRMCDKMDRQAGRFDHESREAVRQIVERGLTLMAHRDAISADIRMLFAFAKEVGFNVRGLRDVIADLRMDKDERHEREAQHHAYRAVLGVDGPEVEIVIAKPAAAVPPAGKKISAKEKNYRDSMALIAAGRIADAS